MLRPTDREPPMVDEPKCCETCGWWEPCPRCKCGRWSGLGWCPERNGWTEQDDTCKAWE